MRVLNPLACISCGKILSQFVFLCLLLTTVLAQETSERSKYIQKQINHLENSHNPGRISAASELGRIRATEAVPFLIQAGQDPDPLIRGRAIEALGMIGDGAKAALPQLIEALKDPDEQVRQSALLAIDRMKASALEAVPQLIEILKDPNAEVRSYGALALGNIGEDAKGAVPQLIEVLKDPDDMVRKSAVSAIANIKGGASAAVPQLVRTLGDSNTEVRRRAVFALGQIGNGAKGSVPQLSQALKDPDEYTRISAAFALGRINGGGIPDLIEALQDPNARVRMSVVEALGEIRDGVEETLPRIIQALNDPDGEVRGAAAETLSQLSTRLARERATKFSSQLKTAAESMRNSGDPLVQQHAERVQQASDLLRLLWWEHLTQWVMEGRTRNLAIAAYPLLLLVWLALLVLRPIWLLNINEALAKITDIKLPGWLLGISIAPRYLILVGFFHYRPRVLDAWVNQYTNAAQEIFSSLPTVKQREIYVPLPVIIGNESEADLSPKKLKPTFTNKTICLQIWGEGGAGKTSLACRLAQWAMVPQKEARLNAEHPMLPILIEQDLVVQHKEYEFLFKVIRQQVKLMIKEDDSPPEALVRQLLKKRRLLVVIDGFSEMSEQSRRATLAGISELPVNALIITTRTEQQFSGLRKTEIKPMRIKGNRLSTFMEVYLTARRKRELFDDDEFFEACLRLSLIVGDRDITALLAKIYAEQMISLKEQVTDIDAPENIPELMLSYLNDLCRNARPDEPDIRVVHRSAKIIAWECLKKSLKPTPAAREDALSALGGEEQGKPLLEYLEARPNLIQTVGIGHDRIRFVLDPLAEYLAGMHLVEENGEDEPAWCSFLAKVDQHGAIEDIKGFLLALRDCCLAREGTQGIKAIADELARRAGISPDESDRYRIERRIKQLISRLKSSEFVDRINAAAELGAYRSAAKIAVKDLCRLLGDQDSGVRTSAIIALGLIGAKEAVPHLIEALKDPNVDIRMSVSEALTTIGEGARTIHYQNPLGDLQ